MHLLMFVYKIEKVAQCHCCSVKGLCSKLAKLVVSILMAVK